MFNFCPFCGYKIEEQSKNGFQCLNCQKWTHYSSPAAVGIAVKVGDEGLIAVRGRDPGKGKMDLVGGFVEYGEDPLDASVREFQEEAGIAIDKNELKFIGMWVDAYPYQGEGKLILGIVYLLEIDKKFDGKPADDVADLKWMKLSEKPDFAFPYLHKAWEKIK